METEFICNAIVNKINEQKYTIWMPCGEYIETSMIEPTSAMVYRGERGFHYAIVLQFEHSDKQIYMFDIETPMVDRAENRVRGNSELSPHYNTIFYDWAEDDHLEWVATADIDEIVSWAEAVECDE